jgi:hypothetical protein
VSAVIHASHLPAGLDVAGRAAVIEGDGVSAHAAPMSADLADAVCRRLLDRQRALQDVPVARVIAAIDATARRLCDHGEPARSLVLRGLQAFSGYTPAMAEHVLDRVSLDWTHGPLHELVAAELGGAAAVEGFAGHGRGRRVRAVAPPLGLHVFAGNVPGVSVTSIVRALLVRSAVFGKSAAGEPILAPTFARLLAEVDPVVGDCVAVTYWTGGSADIEAAVLRHAGLVVHYGGAEAIASLRSRAAADTVFVEHGPRISFALIDYARLGNEDGDGGTIDAAAADLARAVALFDQQGCVSPQTAYVLGEPSAAQAFAARVAAHLDTIADVLPRGRLDAAEAAAIRELRTSAEFRAINGADVHLWTGSSLGYTVVAEPDPSFGGSCLNRTLIVRNSPTLEALLDHVRPFGRFLQTVGIAGFAGDRRADVAARLGAVGATRITAISAMPWPPVTWHHDGRGPLRELVRWIDLED